MTEHVPVKMFGPDRLVHLCRDSMSSTMCGNKWSLAAVDQRAIVDCPACVVEGTERAWAIVDALYGWRSTPDGMPVADVVWVAWHPESGEATSGRPVEQIPATAVRKYWQGDEYPHGITAWRPVIRQTTPAVP